MIETEAVTISEAPGLNVVFQECLEKFPELKGKINIKVEKTIDKLEGAKGKDASGRDVVMLWVPDKLWGIWPALKPIIYHELSHFINLHNPDKVFYERADEKSKKMWDILEEIKAIRCES